MPKGDAQLIEPWRKTSQIMGAKDWKKKRYPAVNVNFNSKSFKGKRKSSRWNENQPPAEYSFKVEKVKKQSKGSQNWAKN
jgi:hypothetical protein